MNKKGFTLVEVLAVIVILSLIITIVSTNGFGAFGKAKEKIEKTNIDAIRQAGEVLMLEVKNCDNEYYGDLVTNFGATDCNELKEKAITKTFNRLEIGCLNIPLKYLLDNNYISGKGIEEIYKNNNTYKIKGCLDSNQKEISMIVPEEITPEIETIKDDISKKNTDHFKVIKDDIVEIHFVSYVLPDDECGIDKTCKRKWKIDEKKLEIAENENIEVWIEDDEYGNYILYVGSNNPIYNRKNSYELFENFINVKEITFDNFSTKYTTNMRAFFRNCLSLEKVNLSDFADTTALKNTPTMFEGASSLKEIDLSKFNTSAVTNMTSMFSGATSLTKIKFGENFKTNNVTNMNSMFKNTPSLTELDLSNFNTSKATHMNSMFEGASSIKELNLSNFNTSNVKKMESMFSGATSLTKITFGDNFNTNNVTTMSSMFKDASSLTELNLSNFNTSNVTDMSNMFNGATNLTTLNIDTFNTSKVTSMAHMFQNASSLTQLDVTSFDTSNVTDMSNMFRGCKSLTELNLENFNNQKVKSFSSIFSECENLTNLTLSNNFVTSAATDTNFMFNWCRNIETLDLMYFDTRNVTNSEGMFNGMSNLELILLNKGYTDNIIKEIPSSFSLITGSDFAYTKS